MREPDGASRRHADEAGTSTAGSAASWILLGLAGLFAVFALVQLLSSPRSASAAMAGPAARLAPGAAGPEGAGARPAHRIDRADAAGGGAGAEAAAARSAARPLDVVHGKIERGETLTQALDDKGVPVQTVHVIATQLSPVFNFRYAKPGDHFTLARDGDGELVSFEYQQSPLERYLLERDGDDWHASRIEPDVKVRDARIAGLVTSSLYDAITSLGEQGELASDFASIFAWDVDFARDVRPGDRFSILYERRSLVRPDGSELYLGPGRILAARYVNDAGEHTAFYYKAKDGEDGYYRADGTSVRREFLKAPLRYDRISSRYSLHRFQPILKIWRPHFGIDYAAPTGTPAWAVARGKVIFIGRDGGLGNTVKIRHANGYVSYYGHLSRFARHLHVGQRVEQKQVVGYVGSTGLSTGPHLHFGMKRYGHFVNPAVIKQRAGDPIPRSQLAAFRSERDAFIDQLDAGRGLTVATSEAL